ncbi:GDSL esterase/lipase [Hibiscus syriacus]|uniref:GDSL esterase/lipase n=1 Tax=Hibiscus syriacus TaxID=106335 RepID=A0A6A2YYZ7_HIBSY|nr:GDSL esterase/lipase [Hibiscus syriacus]
MANSLVFQIITLLCFLSAMANCVQFNYPAVFNFGDSNSDTGELVAALGDILNPPHGQNYFKAPSGRFCDGRLIVDFLMDAMDLPFLNAYLDSIGIPSFRKGCNFAAGVDHPTGFSTSFKGKRLDKYLPGQDYFQKGLYMFDIGQNDLAGAFYSKTYDQVLASIPTILIEFETGIKVRFENIVCSSFSGFPMFSSCSLGILCRHYDQGARNFWIHNTGPLGCLAQNVAKFGTDPSSLDERGCVSKHNQAAKVFNLQLHALTKKLQGQYTDSNFTYVDIYTIKYNLISNYSKLGFEQPIMACCGFGGPPLNYDSRIACGKRKRLMEPQ